VVFSFWQVQSGFMISLCDTGTNVGRLSESTIWRLGNLPAGSPAEGGQAGSPYIGYRKAGSIDYTDTLLSYEELCRSTACAAFRQVRHIYHQKNQENQCVAPPERRVFRTVLFYQCSAPTERVVFPAFPCCFIKNVSNSPRRWRDACQRCLQCISSVFT